MNLIIRDFLSEAPTDYLAFFFLTQCVKTQLHMNILLLTEQEMKDLYFHYLREKGLFDYIDYILTPEEKEFGIRLDNNYDIPPTVKVDFIRLENQIKIFNTIRDFRRMVKFS